MMIKYVIAAITLFFFTSKNEKADLLVYNAVIYTVDENFTTTNAMVLRNGKIIETGDRKALEKKYSCKEKLDANGKFIYPGFIDAHAHFLGYGQTLKKVNLTETQSWADCLQRVKEFIEKTKPATGSWITGRGWDQNDWAEKEFPSNTELNQLYPQYYFLLSRIDGHAAIASENALAKAGIQPGQQINGGQIETKNGKLTGILVDNATDLVSEKIPSLSKKETSEALQLAEKNCFAAGLTTVDDCGLGFADVALIEEMHRTGALKMKLYVMLSDGKMNYQYLFQRGKIKTDRLTVNGFKLYADGALGSRGACLLHPYTDKPGQTGFLLSNAAYFDSIAQFIYKNNFQMCTHAIGDSGTRVILKTYSRYLKKNNDRRWRIEHAQVVAAADFSWFKKYSIIPSVQPTHATSDMYWATDRLGKDRVKNAYSFKQLMKQNGWLPLGTDFPVEDISPIKTFYAATIRKDASGWPANGFQMENALTRTEALRGMTIWAAKSNFEETDKGSLEKGKYADFIILDTDLLNCAPEKILNTKVLATYVNGEKVYGVR
jgi:predicted amidohydrolase YtcJ